MGFPNNRANPATPLAWRWSLTLMLSGLILAACGARAPQLQPPALRIVELELADDDTVEIRLRIRNPVAATLPADRLEFTLLIDERELGRFSPPFDLDVPGLGNELVTVETPSPPAISDLLRRVTAGERARAPYRIEGELVHSDGQSTLPIESRGWLSPTPGKPGSFR